MKNKRKFVKIKNITQTGHILNAVLTLKSSATCVADGFGTHLLQYTEPSKALKLPTFKVTLHPLPIKSKNVNKKKINKIKYKSIDGVIHLKQSLWNVLSAAE